MRVTDPLERGSRATRLEVVSMLAWKMRITVLWIFVAVCNVAILILTMFEPGAIRDLMAGEWMGADARSARVQIAVAFNVLGPVALAFLTLALEDVASRRTNVVFGVALAVYAILTMIALLGGTFGAGATFAALVGCLVALLIAWHAWKWPRPSEVAPSQQLQETTRRGA